MKLSAIPFIGCLTICCGEGARSQQSDIAPQSETFVVTGKYTFDDSLWRRLSLIMPKGSIELYNLEGASTLDMVGLAVKGKLAQKDAYEHISRSDFKAFKLVKVDASSYGPYDLVEYETGRKIGRLGYWSAGSRYILTELCTGSSEKLCTFSYDQESAKFAFEFLAQDS
ncbi:MAG TPA: hypothetical protein VE954_11255 [Oligoflexus sp.]|uniref:hypothetical protein n=1 Tax=Oligoflexus sp. TaxID=1971216 RepID=UPI002D31DB5F|nr:hypothetical protein [Oligoflexus sp.]HYX33682.1 hypothetical protein [Oligoflexus sp.]